MLRHAMFVLVCLGAAIVAAAALSSAATARGGASSAVDLGTLGGTQSVAVAVNSAGEVVGTSSIAGDAEFHAFAWTRSRGMVDLGTLGGQTTEALAVNASRSEERRVGKG